MGAGGGAEMGAIFGTLAGVLLAPYTGGASIALTYPAISAGGAAVATGAASAAVGAGVGAAMGEPEMPKFPELPGTIDTRSTAAAERRRIRAQQTPTTRASAADAMASSVGATSLGGSRGGRAAGGGGASVSSGKLGSGGSYGA